MSEKRESLTGDVMVGVCLGHNDHEIVKFKRLEYGKKVSKVATLDFKREIFNQLKELVSCVPWQFALEVLEVHERQLYFKN